MSDKRAVGVLSSRAPGLETDPFEDAEINVAPVTSDEGLSKAGRVAYGDMMRRAAAAR